MIRHDDPLTHHYREGSGKHRLTQVGRALRLTALMMAGVIGGAAIASASEPVDPLLLASKEYMAYRHPGVKLLPVDKDGPLFVQVEEDRAFLKDFVDNTDDASSTAIERHGEAAAEIIKEISDQILRPTAKGTEVLFINARFPSMGISQELGPLDQLFIDKLLDQAFIITLSQAGDSRLPDAFARTISALQNSPALIVQSAGNVEGDDNVAVNDAGKHRTDYIHISQFIEPLQFAPAALRVGAANGHNVANYSVCSTDVDIIATNPFYSGFRYQYYRTPAEIRANALKYAPFDFSTDPALRKKYDAFIAAAQKTVLAKNAADIGKFVADLDGTSFTAPNVGGQAAALRKMYPQLDKIDVMVAALLAARDYDLPTYQAPDGSHQKPVRLTYQYHKGLWFDAECAGYGLETPERFTQNMADMAAIQKKNPSSATQPAYLTGITMLPSKPGVYRVHVDAQDTAVRVHMLATFEDIFNKYYDKMPSAPRTVTLISPEGTRIKIRPGADTELDQKQVWHNYAVGTTTGFLGDATAGNWQVVVSPKYHMQTLTLSIDAVKPGGIIDKLIDETAAKIAAIRPAALRAGGRQPR